MLNPMQEHMSAAGKSTELALAIQMRQMRDATGQVTKKDRFLKRTYMRKYLSLNSPMIAKMVLGRSTMKRMSMSRMYLKAFSLGIEPQQRPVGF